MPVGDLSSLVVLQIGIEIRMRHLLQFTDSVVVRYSIQKINLAYNA